MRQLTHLSLLLATGLLWPAAGNATVQPGGPGCGAAYSIPSIYWGSGVQAAGFDNRPFRPGQTFTPRFGGVLAQVNLGFWSQGSSRAIVEIRTVAGGVPTTTVLGQASAPPGPYPDHPLYEANFMGQGIVLQAGVRYAITLRTDGVEPIEVLGSFEPHPVDLTGTNDFVWSDDAGATWAIWPHDHRAFVYEVCVDAATPTRRPTWGSLKATYH
jgi:hypothetical protein